MTNPIRTAALPRLEQWLAEAEAARRVWLRDADPAANAADDRWIDELIRDLRTEIAARSSQRHGRKAVS